MTSPPCSRLKHHHRPHTPGVCYAITDAGLELPIIDVTHDAFTLHVSEVEQAKRIADFVREQRSLARLPKLLRLLLLRLALHGSVLADAIRQAETGFLTGLHTYMFKLGPRYIADVSDKPIDRKIAEALPAWSMRMRLQDCAKLLSEALLPQLQAAERAGLWLFNIAGGPALDSLNALILLRRQQPGLLESRVIQICVLDLDREGPSFGARALAALCAQGAPLRGLQIGFESRSYDWSRAADLTAPLQAAVHAGAVCAVSSEAGLFEYGSDPQIEANLRALRAAGPASICVVGSVTRADEPVRLLRMSNPVRTQPRGLTAFSELARRAGWDVQRAIEGPFSDQVLLAVCHT